MGYYTILQEFYHRIITRRSPQKRKPSPSRSAGPECLERRQLLVSNPVGNWILTTNAHTGDGTAVITAIPNGLQVAGAFPDFEMTFGVNAKKVGGDPDKFRGKGGVEVFGVRAKIKFEFNFTSETAFTGTSSAKFKGSAKFTQEINGTKAVG